VPSRARNMCLHVGSFRAAVLERFRRSDKAGLSVAVNRVLQTAACLTILLFNRSSLQLAGVESTKGVLRRDRGGL